MAKAGRKAAGSGRKRTRRAAEEVPAAAPYWVYVLRCRDGSLYTGVARDIDRRLAQHNGVRGSGARYTASRRPVVLVYCREFSSRSLAQSEEARIKGLTREEKMKLIGAAVPEPRRVHTVQG